VKRYVTEFANEFLKNPLLDIRIKENIHRYIEACKRGNISSVEAVQGILKPLSMLEEDA